MIAGRLSTHALADRVNGVPETGAMAIEDVDVVVASTGYPEWDNAGRKSGHR